jgi:diguanylate cyclase (GGDEF)-like protein
METGEEGSVSQRTAAAVEEKVEMKERPGDRGLTRTRGWERVSRLSPRAFFWIFCIATTALAALLALAFSLLAWGRVQPAFLLGWLVVASLTAAAASFVGTRIHALAWEKQKSLEHFATVDELTGAPNRRVFTSRLASEVDRCSRLRSALCVVFIDIDFFKRINDDFGHHVGDRVLKGIYARLEENLRLYDFLGRLGGDEFVMALPGTDGQTAFGVAERLRESVQRYPPRDLPGVTISLGVAGLAEGMSADQLVRNADLALYTAKNNGRNRTEVYRAPAGRDHSPS